MSLAKPPASSRTRRGGNQSESNASVASPPRNEPLMDFDFSIQPQSIAKPITNSAQTQQSDADDFDGFEFAVEATPKASEFSKTSDSSNQSTRSNRQTVAAAASGPAELRSTSASSTARDASINRINALEMMKKGSPFLKYGRFGIPHFRDFHLSHDNLRIVWFSSGKSLNDSSVRLRDIEEIRVGQTTEVFSRHPAPELSGSSMSLIYDNGRRTLDIIAKSPFDFKIWSHALRWLVQKARTSSDEQMTNIPDLPIDVKIIDQNSSSHRGPTDYSYDDNVTKFSSQAELEQSVREEFAEVKRRASKYRARSHEHRVYVSEYFRRVQTLLDDVDAMIVKIDAFVANAEWRQADEMVWQAGVNLETSKNIMKAL